MKFAMPLVPKYKFKLSSVVAAKLNLATFALNSTCTPQNTNLSVSAYFLNSTGLKSSSSSKSHNLEIFFSVCTLNLPVPS